MKRKVFIHIGAHKTGTTSLQKLLCANRKPLEERGILYPRSAFFQFAQHRLAFAAKGMRDRRKGDRPDLDTELGYHRAEIEASSSSTIVISSEEFFAIPPRAVDKIAAAFLDFSVEIIAVLRRPDELFSSIYNQRVKDPKNKCKTHYTEFLENPASLSKDLQFARALGVWAAAFGWEKITIECYESQSDSVGLVLGRMGISKNALPRQGAARINASLSVKAVEVMWHAKHAGLDELTLRRLSEAAGHFLVPSEGVSESLLAPEERLTILEKMNPVTDAIFETCLRRENAYHSSRFRPEDFPPKTELTLTDTVRLLGELLTEPRAIHQAESPAPRESISS